ncbi:permease-like cell division protein FtsX [Papillibacter cinnamivorans]|uniref:Cell division protein FtsX n=1 Tax=Papillibacter cinnamivorans DSM 12816 TaxID=1122930 RepID=A0A1W1ZEI5_9FIRM|nr:permease-like cell division protein FtsX [Papillibacter cinnamivorans]SMC46869.1 cell division transport system permease protein [Papillibacter cinnamivorans DSM 12816]
MKRYNFGYFVHEGVHNIFLHGFMSFAAVGIIVACLIIMGSFTLVAVNADSMLKSLERENEVLAYVNESLSDEEAQALGAVIEQVPNVASCQFISRETAMENFVSQYQGDSLFTDMDPTILRHRYSVKMTDISLMRDTVKALEAVPGIAKVRANLEISEGFITVRNIAGAVSMALILILLAVSVFIISNTIKLATFDRREEIAIMKMVGATNGFIRWPFVYEGLLLGLSGAAIAFFAQWGIYGLVSKQIAGNDTIHLITVIPYAQLAAPVAGIFLATGFLVGVGGSLLAIRKFLKV